MYACIYVCMFVFIYVRMLVFMYVCLYLPMYVIMHVAMYALTFACMHICLLQWCYIISQLELQRQYLKGDLTGSWTVRLDLSDDEGLSTVRSVKEPVGHAARYAVNRNGLDADQVTTVEPEIVNRKVIRLRNKVT